MVAGYIFTYVHLEFSLRKIDSLFFWKIMNNTISWDLIRDIIGYTSLDALRDLDRASPIFTREIYLSGLRVYYGQQAIDISKDKMYIIKVGHSKFVIHDVGSCMMGILWSDKVIYKSVIKYFNGPDKSIFENMIGTWFVDPENQIAVCINNGTYTFCHHYGCAYYMNVYSIVRRESFEPSCIDFNSGYVISPRSPIIVGTFTMIFKDGLWIS